MPIAIDGMKHCANPECPLTQPLSVENFTSHIRLKDGLQPYCKRCNSDYQKLQRRRDPTFASKRTWIHRKNKYGVTQAQFMDMLARQDYLCPICLDNVHAGSSLDHCHILGNIRGILCSNCNTGIGMLRDDPALLRRAIRYLEHAENAENNY